MFTKLTTSTLRHICRTSKHARTKRTASLALCTLPTLSRRTFTKTLFERMHERIPEQQERCKQIMAQTKDQKLSEVTVGQAAGGMRGVKGLICETSSLDADKGIRFRGLTLPEVQQRLPTGACRGADKSEYPIPEAMLWLLLTGEIPTAAEAAQLSEELLCEPYNSVPKHARKIIDELPVHQHPMSQFITGVTALSTESTFAEAYQRGVNRQKYWQYALTDTLHLIAKIPAVSARIFRQTFRDGVIFPADESLDWSANWAKMVGLTKSGNDEVSELMRMYFTIHTDHEGGNVSAHATHLVGSALADPYLSYAAGMCGLAGPLHGLANQESLRWIQALSDKFSAEGKEVNAETITEFAWETLNNKQVIPGFGHAVLRITDPRYTCQRDFALKHLPDDPLFQIVDTIYQVM